MTIETGVSLLLALVFYTYVGYPLMLWVGALLRRPVVPPTSYSPGITVLIPAHNEEQYIDRCLRSVLASDYPRDRLRVLVVSDGSTDRTDQIVEPFLSDRIRLESRNERVGKDAALAAVRKLVGDEILVIMDASSVVMAKSIRRIVRHFQDTTIGSVVGAKTIVQDGASVSQGDGLYWRYDSLLRTLESRNGSSWVGVEGGLFAIRKELFEVDLGKGLSVDLALGGRVCVEGKRNLYDPAAVVYEVASDGMNTEFKRKIRVIVRGMRAFFFSWRLFNPFLRPGFVFQNVSHKLLRWLVPFFLLGILGGSMVSEDQTLQVLLFCQASFYLVAGFGLVFRDNGGGKWIFSVPAYFCSMNAAALVAWFLLFRRFDIWEPPQRGPRSIVK